MKNYNTVGLYWIDENGYYHYPAEDQFEFGRLDAEAGGGLKNLDDKVKALNTLAENEYSAGYEAGYKNNTANAKAEVILGLAGLATVGLVLIGVGVLAYKVAELDNKKELEKEKLNK